MTWLVWIIVVACVLFVWVIIAFGVAYLFGRLMRMVNRSIEEAWDEPIYTDNHKEGSE